MQLFCNLRPKNLLFIQLEFVSFTCRHGGSGCFLFFKLNKKSDSVSNSNFKTQWQKQGCYLERKKKPFGDLKDWMKSNKCFNLLNVMITGDLSAQCHYCTHYSSAIIVASYLVRMEPFSQTFLHLQVNFSPVWPGLNYITLLLLQRTQCYKNSNQ